MHALRDSSTPRARLASLAFERGGLLVVVIAVVYAWLVPAHIVDGENAEFSALTALGGGAHPSGYPLYVLWLRLWSWLPGASVAHTAGLATVILGTATCAVMHAACRAWGARPFAASFATAVFAMGPVIIRLHTTAEVFAMNDLVLVLVLWLAAERGPARGTWRAVLLGLVAGLGISDHVTCVLIAPVGILGVVRGIREAERPALRTIALTFGALALGLAPYAYLLVAPDTPISWGKAHDLGDVLAIFTRQDYGGPFAFSPDKAAIDVAANLGALAGTLARGWLYLPLLIGVGTLGWRSVRSEAEGEPRTGWRLLAASWLVAGPILIARFNVEPVDLGLLVVQRFHILPMLLLAIPIAVGLDRVLAAIGARTPALARPIAGEVLAAAVAIVVAAASLPHSRAVNSRAVEAGAANMLRSLPPNAVVITQSDPRAPVVYAQEVLGIRPDVIVVTWKMVPMAWYRARLAARGLVIDPKAADRDGPPSVKVAEQIFAAGRPLVVDQFEGNILKEYASYPHAMLLRVLPRGAKQLTLDEIVALNHELYGAFDLDYPHPGPDDGYPAGIHQRYASTWAILAKALSDAGRKSEARDALELARTLAPTD